MLATKEKNLFLQSVAKIILWIILAYSFYFSIWTIFYTETGNGDNVEHIHATWLVAMGKIPYLDFFQHHNPLLWYIFAPFIRNFTDLKIILDVFHAVGVFFGIGIFWITYKISTRFFSDKYASLLAILILCSPCFYIYCFNYNPDTFMAFSFAIGLYYLFKYLDETVLKDLVISFFAFFISFMFTQKVLVLLSILGAISLFIFIRRKTKISDIIYALLLPILCTLLFIVYLHYHDALSIYIKSNYLFNIRMQDYYGNFKINVMDHEYLIFSLSLTILSIIFLFKKESIYFKITSILFIWELVQRVFFFSIAPYYMLPIMIFSVCLNSVIISKILKKQYIVVFVLLGVSIFYAGISKDKYLAVRSSNRDFVNFLKVNTTPCDYVLSGYLGTQTIITKDPHYYWALLGHIDVAGEELGIAKKPNINLLIQQYKPKIVNGNPYWNSYYYHRGLNEEVQRASPKLLEKYYLPTPYSGLYLLKYEYHGKNCQYNKETGEWLYENL